MFSSIPDFYPLKASSTPVVTANVSTRCQTSLGVQEGTTGRNGAVKLPLVENYCFRIIIGRGGSSTRPWKAREVPGKKLIKSHLRMCIFKPRSLVTGKRRWQEFESRMEHRNYLGGSNVITRSFRRERRKQESQRRLCDNRFREREKGREWRREEEKREWGWKGERERLVDFILLALKIEERFINQGIQVTSKRKKSKEIDSSLELPCEMQTCWQFNV